MTLAALIHSIGSIGLFPSRAFLPAFLTALLLRHGSDVPLIQNSGILLHVTATPTWFTSDMTLWILGILSALEFVATKSPDVREFLHDFDPFIKCSTSFLTTAGVLGTTDAQVLGAIQGHPSTIAGFGLSATVAAAVYFVSSLRSGVMHELIQADPNDDLHLQGLISWCEDLWSLFGLALIVLFPLLMVGAVMVIAGLLYGIQRYLEYCEDKSKVPCAGCKTPIYSVALACPACKKESGLPLAIGFLGMPSRTAVANRQVHALDLIAKKRCPVCATRFAERVVRQSCVGCGHALMASASERDAFLTHIDQRLPKTMGICFALGLIPIVGIIPGMIYYRIKLIAPLRQYIPFGTGLLVKWGVRLLNLMLILFQWVPGVGAVMIPLMAFTNYRVYRRVYAEALSSPAPASPSPKPAVSLATGNTASDEWRMPT